MNQQKKIPYNLDVQVFSDDRGVFVPFLDAGKNADLFAELGGIKRIYYLNNYSRGTVRGLHYHDKEWKVFNVLNGSAKIVAIDPNNPDNFYTFVSSDRKNNLVVIPPGYANGWVSLSSNTILFCASNLTTEESLADDKRYDPYKWGDVWSVKPR